jgi:hypothetical protein
LELKGIDFHVHLSDEFTIAANRERTQQMARYFGKERKPVSFDELADVYRRKNMMAVLMNSTDVTVTGRAPVPNDHIAAAVKSNPDIFIGFGVVDPLQGKVAIDEAKRCVEELGLRGIGELNPGRQHFYCNSKKFYPLWSVISDLKVPVLFHTGMAGAGAGTPGGGGVKLKYTRPIPYLDDLAADFPELTIIGAHPSWPYEPENLAIARHKSNFFIDLSGWAPKYFSEQLVRYVDSIIVDKALFGSDWPVMALDRWLEEFDGLDLKPASRSKIMLENARKILNI